MKARNPSTGNLEEVYVKALDSLPVGTEVDFNGSTSDIPAGWEQVESPTNAITARLTSSYTTTTSNYEKLPLVSYLKIGSKLLVFQNLIVLSAVPPPLARILC